MARNFTIDEAIEGTENFVEHFDLYAFGARMSHLLFGNVENLSSLLAAVYNEHLSKKDFKMLTHLVDCSLIMQAEETTPKTGYLKPGIHRYEDGTFKYVRHNLETNIIYFAEAKSKEHINELAHEMTKPLSDYIGLGGKLRLVRDILSDPVSAFKGLRDNDRIEKQIELVKRLGDVYETRVYAIRPDYHDSGEKEVKKVLLAFPNYR